MILLMYLAAFSRAQSRRKQVSCFHGEKLKKNVRV